MYAYYKIVHDNMIKGFGTKGSKAEEVESIKKAEYNELLSVAAKQPKHEEVKAGYTYALQQKPLEWIQIEIPDEDPEKTVK